MIGTKIKLAAGLIGIMVFAACSGNQTPDKSSEATKGQVTVEKTVIPAANGEEKYVATLQIDGMGCAMACGSKISGTLAGLDGVNHTDIDFIGAGEANTAIVSFDASVVTESEMIRAVNEMKGGHYEVKHVQVVHYTGTPQGSKTQKQEADEEKVSILSPKLEYTLPNIFSVFSRLF